VNVNALKKFIFLIFFSILPTGVRPPAGPAQEARK